MLPPVKGDTTKVIALFCEYETIINKKTDIKYTRFTEKEISVKQKWLP